MSENKTVLEQHAIIGNTAAGTKTLKERLIRVPVGFSIPCSSVFSFTSSFPPFTATSTFLGV